MNIYLIGMRAVGKSSVGRLLAKSMDRPFLDLDLELASEFGQSIAEYVRLNGWKRFRLREADIVARAADLKDYIVATGGGVIELDTNVALMRASGWVVWLKAGLNTLKHRLLEDTATSSQRPVVGKDPDPAAELKSLMQSRMHAYQKAMDIAVETEKRGLESICRQIIEAYHRRA
jgi:shikimate kinase